MGISAAVCLSRHFAVNQEGVYAALLFDFLAFRVYFFFRFSDRGVVMLAHRFLLVTAMAVGASSPAWAQTTVIENINTSWTAQGDAIVSDGVGLLGQDQGEIRKTFSLAAGVYDFFFRYAVLNPPNPGGLDNELFWSVNDSSANFNLLSIDTVSSSFLQSSPFRFTTTGSTTVVFNGENIKIGDVSFQAVPGPVAGAGLPVLALAGYLAWRRRRSVAA